MYRYEPGESIFTVLGAVVGIVVSLGLALGLIAAFPFLLLSIIFV